MTMISFNMNNLLTARYSGQPAQQAALWAAPLVYSAYTRVSFASPPYSAPGGTIYKRGTTAVYYPQGNEWGPARVADYAALDSLAATTGICAACDPRYYEAYHLLRQLQLQARFTDGRTYAGRSTDVNAEDKMLVREQLVANDLATAWTNEYLAPAA